MKYHRTLVMVATLGFVALSVPAFAEGDPPTAEVKPHELKMHGDVRVDNYYWLRDRDNPQVIAYLEAENAYTESVMAPTTGLQTLLFDEIKGRVKQTDASVPYRIDDYYYYTRNVDGQSYKIYCRKAGSLTAPEEIVLDVNVLAEGKDFMAVWAVRESPDHNILAYAADDVGRRKFTIYFKDLQTGEMLADVIPNVTYNLRWANDNKTVFYTRQDPETLRWHQVYRHKLGTDSADDVLVFEEKDDEFSCWVYRSISHEYLMIESEQTLSSEVWYLNADHAQDKFAIFSPREANHEYSVDHVGDNFYIRTNDHAENFRLMATPIADTEKSSWIEIIPNRDDVFLVSFDLFDNYLVAEERKNGLMQIRIRPWAGGEEHYLDFDEPAYDAYTKSNYSANTDLLRFAYMSMATPMTTYDYNMATHERELLKQEEIGGGFDPSNYQTDRLFATASDGTRVPISILYRKGLERDGDNPALLYGYGSYGSSMDASFRSSRFSLVDRGFVYAIAHVRGGQELGRQWYEDGKLLNKKNTFTDFIACAEHLVEEGYTSPDHLYAMGGSAGGLLMGAIANMRPDLFNGIIAHVPWVDVVTTMLDPSIPLTTAEYDEWGDPNEQEYYEYMLSYSPYDNVGEHEYPNILITTGLHDSQVQYFEPAKWVAKMRAMKTDDNRLLLKTYMDAGHGGGSGRYRRYRETAFDFSFVLSLENMVPENAP